MKPRKTVVLQAYWTLDSLCGQISLVYFEPYRMEKNPVHRKELQMASQGQDTLHSLSTEACTKATPSGCSEDALRRAVMRACHIHVPSPSSTILNLTKLWELKDYSNLFGIKT